MTMLEFVGGKYNGEVHTLLWGWQNADGVSEDMSEFRKRGGLCQREELDNKPTFDGYCGPMWNGVTDGVKVLRYETWEVYDILSR